MLMGKKILLNFETFLRESLFGQNEHFSLFSEVIPFCAQKGIFCLFVAHFEAKHFFWKLFCPILNLFLGY